MLQIGIENNAFAGGISRGDELGKKVVVGGRESGIGNR